MRAAALHLRRGGGLQGRDGRAQLRGTALGTRGIVRLTNDDILDGVDVTTTDTVQLYGTI